jgi:predicted RNA-binding Zn ribbon-like protein
LFLELINSEFYDGFGEVEERLDKAEWLAEFAAEIGLETTALIRGRRRLIELRQLLRETVEALPGKDFEPSRRHLKRLNEYLAAAPIRLQLLLTAEGARIEPATAENLDGALARIALSLAQALSVDPRRIKVCENDGCRWAFIDQSRNRSRRWCESTACGNLFKVRAFRRRTRGKP